MSFSVIVVNLYFVFIYCSVIGHLFTLLELFCIFGKVGLSLTSFSL